MRLGVTCNEIALPSEMMQPMGLGVTCNETALPSEMMQPMR
jgi:hypothetical protein